MALESARIDRSRFVCKQPCGCIGFFEQRFKRTTIFSSHGTFWRHLPDEQCRNGTRAIAVGLCDGAWFSDTVNNEKLKIATGQSDLSRFYFPNKASCMPGIA